MNNRKLAIICATVISVAYLAFLYLMVRLAYQH